MPPLLEKHADPMKTWRLCYQLASVIAALPSMKQDSPDCFKCVFTPGQAPCGDTVCSLFFPSHTHTCSISIFTRVHFFCMSPALLRLSSST